MVKFLQHSGLAPEKEKVHMKKLVSVLLCLMLVLGYVSTSGAEAFDPTANIWYRTRAEFVTEYENGEVKVTQGDYTKPMASYTYIELEPDGTGVMTIAPPGGPEYIEYGGTWTQPSATQVQFAYEYGTTLLEYTNGQLVEVAQGQSSEYAETHYTYTNTFYYTDDADGAVRAAINNYIGQNKEWDVTTTEEMLQKDLLLTAYLPVYTFSAGGMSFTRDGYETMGEDGNGWIGYLDWDENANEYYFNLETEDKLFLVQAPFGEYVYVNCGISVEAYSTVPGELTQPATVSVVKYADRECYNVCIAVPIRNEYGELEAADYNFQAVPMDVVGVTAMEMNQKFYEWFHGQ